MGYYIEVTEVNVSIKKQYEGEIVWLFKQEAERRRFTWTHDLSIVTNLVELMRELRYELYDDQSIDCYSIEEFTGEKLGDEERIFNLLAPYIESDGYISFRGENNDLWRYEFKDGHMQEKTGEIIWR